MMASATFGLTSCDEFLEEKPLDQKSSSQFWQSKEDAQTGVDALYFGGVPYLNQNGGGWQPKATMYGGIISGLFFPVLPCHCGMSSTKVSPVPISCWPMCPR